MKETFLEIYREHIKRPGADKLLEWLENSDFFTAPASTRFHLCRPGGLLEHSIHVYERLRELYLNELDIGDGPHELNEREEETIAICGLLHDICKVDVYKQEYKNQKTYDAEKVKNAQKWEVKKDANGSFIWESVVGYKYEDSLPYGHGEKSVYIISGFMKLSREEAMAIRWHMGFSGEDDNRNVGNAFGLHKMAVLTHIADMMATYLDEQEEH